MGGELESIFRIGEALKFVCTVLVAMAVQAMTPVSAHHGPPTNEALFFADELVEIEGELTEVLWRNPHVRARVRAAGEDGRQVTWDLHLGPSPGALESRGYSADDFPGAVKAAGFVSRRSPDSLGVVNLLLPNGQEWALDNQAMRWSGTGLAEPAPIDETRVTRAEQAAEGIFRVWGRRSGLGAHYRASVEAQALTETGRALANAYDPVVDNLQLACLQGMPDAMFDPSPLEIIDRGAHIVIHIQQMDAERVVHMDMEEPSAGRPSSSLGHSTGNWDGNELVVTTSNIDWPYYAETGTPQSTQAHYVERFSIEDGGEKLNYSITIADPLTFAEPFTIEATRDWAPGVEIEPYNCAFEWEEPAD